MSILLSIPKTGETLPLDGLLSLTRASFGLGVGLLIAERLNRPARQATAIALVSLGTLAVIPLVVKMAMARINRPESTASCGVVCVPFVTIPVMGQSTIFINIFLRVLEGRAAGSSVFFSLSSRF